jgi:HSP20 family protein
VILDRDQRAARRAPSIDRAAIGGVTERKDPTMADLTRFDPFAGLARFEPFRGLDPFFRYAHVFPRDASEAPEIRMDVTEDAQAYRVKAEIPGVRKEDIKVAIDGNQVSISAEVKREKEEKTGESVIRSERYHGTQYRAFTVAREVDRSKAEARYENGVLDLLLPKKAGTTTQHLTVESRTRPCGRRGGDAAARSRRRIAGGRAPIRRGSASRPRASGDACARLERAPLHREGPAVGTPGFASTRRGGDAAPTVRM